MMTSPLPEARPFAWTARRPSEFERYEGAFPSPQPPAAGRGKPFRPLASMTRMLRRA